MQAICNQSSIVDHSHAMHIKCKAVEFRSLVSDAAAVYEIIADCTKKTHFTFLFINIDRIQHFSVIF